MLRIELIILTKDKVIYPIPSRVFHNNGTGDELAKTLFADFVACSTDWLRFVLIDVNHSEDCTAALYTVLVPDMVELINGNWVNLKEEMINGKDADKIYRASLKC